MTHTSFSKENNKAFIILSANVIETSISFHLLSKDVDVSSKELNRRLSQITNMDFSLISCSHGRLNEFVFLVLF
ncbi:Protein NUCLEAR FUSION DEFECTIVE 2 [Glycine soja]|uniref:Protein NUCLEAR FUSION DEFECTIVE 2 n=1 Tax=Glycine soja TaxID=3848 RepID=A0A445H4Z3_GLYSO|nr:Protein NUCLEAR FUSION DEFECTIVE 2 [Glycine soja]